MTPVACRYFLGHLAAGRLLEARRARDRSPRQRLRRRAPANAARCAGSSSAARSSWSSPSGFVAARLPSTFFPDIDESMERIYVRFAPGTSLEEASRMTDEIGKRLGQELRKDNVELVLANVGSPNNARSAMTSPNWGPYMGFIRLALTDPEQRKLSQQQIADKSRADPRSRLPRRRVSAGAGRPRRQRLRQRLHRAARRRGARRQARVDRRAGARGRRGDAQRCRACATCARRST